MLIAGAGTVVDTTVVVAGIELRVPAVEIWSVRGGDAVASVGTSLRDRTDRNIPSSTRLTAEMRATTATLPRRMSRRRGHFPRPRPSLSA
jgi:hypothetical protein